MTDAINTAATKPVELVDFDNGGGWGKDKIVLNHPFKLAGVEYAEIAFRVPSGGDFNAWVMSPGNGYRDLMIRLTQLDDKVFDAMHGSDYARVNTRMGEFFAGTR